MTEAFHINVLGPLEVLHRGAAVCIEGTRKRQLLAALVAARGDVVPVDRLHETLWGPNPPPSARASLQSHVSRLRDRLQPELEVVTMWSGYALDLDAAVLDVVQFESLVEEADRAACVEVLAEALGLWRGDAFSGFAELPSVKGEALRLDELRLTTTERWMDARLAADEQGLVGELEALVTEQPLREHFWCQLMVALHRSGRQAEALRRAADLRTVLGDLGLQPSPAVRQLEFRMLAEDATLRADPVRRVRRPASAGLGREATSLIGRESDVAAVLDALATYPVVTVCGAGGVGKTRLARRVAHAARNSFEDAVVVELAPVRGPGAVAQVVAAALDVEQRQQRSLEATIEHFLEDKSLLLVLDNCEHVLEAAAPLVDRLRRSCPAVTVLATSREPLGLPGEHIHLAAPLTVPAAGVSSVPEVGAASAVQLFVDRARAGRPDYALTEVEAPYVAEICRRLDGLPLAVELAAARMRTMGSRALAARLDQRFALLSGDGKIADPRHQTLHHLVEWSYDLLDPAEQEVFAQLSVFAGSFALDAAETVCRLSSIDQPDVAGLLVNLVDKSMVQLIDADEPRYRVLETLREFGHARLEDAGRRDLLEDGHRSWYLALAERAELGLEGPDEGRWSETVARDFDNFRAAHASAVRCGDLACAARLVTALQEFSFRRIRYEITTWAETTTEMEGFADDPRAGTVVAISAYGHWVRGDLDAAIDLAGRSRQMHEVHSRAPSALAERVLGNALFYCGRTDEALAAMEAMLAGAGASGSASRLAHALYMSSVAQTSIGNPAGGAELADRARAAADECGSPTAAAQAAYARGLARRSVDVAEAGRALQDAAELGASAGNRWIHAFALTEVHSLGAESGDLVAALEGLAGVIDSWHRGGDWANQWLSLRHVFGILSRLDGARSAAVVYGALVAAGAASALPSSPGDVDDMSVQVALVRQRVTPAEFDAASRAGAAMSDNDLIAYVEAEIERCAS